MGGLAHKKIDGNEGRRISRREKQRILDFFSENFYTFTLPIVEVQEKENFGDIDFVTWGDYDIKKMIGLINTLDHSSSGYHVNGITTTLDFDGVQIDLNRYPNYERAKLARTYYNNNDLGNLIGRIAHSLGLQYGHEGLKATIREESFKTHIHLTNHLPDIYYILGFRDGSLKKLIEYNDVGFPTFREMFETVSESIYFDSKIYAFENLNNANRVRNQKRNVYQNFVEFCEEIQKEGKKVDSRWFMLEQVKAHDREKEYFEIYYRIARSKQESLYFNYNRLFNMFGESEKDNLPKFISWFKKEKWDVYRIEVLYYEEKKIDRLIEESYNEFKEITK